MGTRRQRGGCPGAGTILSASTDTHTTTHTHTHTDTHRHTHPNLPPGTKGHHVIEAVSELRGWRDGRDTQTQTHTQELYIYNHVYNFKVKLRIKAMIEECALALFSGLVVLVKLMAVEMYM